VYSKKKEYEKAAFIFKKNQQQKAIKRTMLFPLCLIMLREREVE